MSVTLYVDGNWTLVKDTSGHTDMFYIIHTGCLNPLHGKTYRYDKIIDTKCHFCDEAAPEGLRALYHLMVWDE